MAPLLDDRRVPDFLTGADLSASVPTEDHAFTVLGPHHSPLQLAIMPVVGWDGRRLIPFGTCFSMTSTGVVLTAWHVIEDFVEEYGGATHEGEAGLYVIYESDQPISLASQTVIGGPIPVVSYANSGQNDICLLKLALPRRPQIRLPPIAVHVGRPVPGAGCSAIGYPLMSLEGDVLRREANLERVTDVVYERRVAVSRGRVEEIHDERRDRMMDFPCFMTTARFDPGMSGGPVVTDDGQVCGIVCSDFQLAEAESGVGPISYASLLAPVLELEVAQSTGSATVTELAARGAIAVTGHEDLDVRAADDGRRLWYRASTTDGGP